MIRLAQAHAGQHEGPAAKPWQAALGKAPCALIPSASAEWKGIGGLGRAARVRVQPHAPTQPSASSCLSSWSSELMAPLRICSSSKAALCRDCIQFKGLVAMPCMPFPAQLTFLSFEQGSKSSLLPKNMGDSWLAWALKSNIATELLSCPAK